MLKRIKQYKERHTQDFQMKESPPNSKKFINLDILKKLKIAYIPYNELLKEGFITGIGWAFGVTLGFVLVSTFLVLIFRILGGLPLIGGLIADIIQETQSQLLKRTPISPK